MSDMPGRAMCGVDERVPTHDEVAAALDDIPGAADFVRRNHNLCWGDLLFDAQAAFPPSAMAAAIRRMVLKGWGRYVEMVWCPWSPELAAMVQEARELKGRHAKRGWLKRLLERDTLHGALGMVQGAWKKARAQWMAEAGTREGDPDLIAVVVFWLEHSAQIRAGNLY